MPSHLVTIDDLRVFKMELLEELSNIISVDDKPSKQFLKSSEVRKLLRISPGTLQTLRIKGDIPYTRIGGTILYDYNEIMKLINDNKEGLISKL